MPVNNIIVSRKILLCQNIFTVFNLLFGDYTFYIFFKVSDFLEAYKIASW